MDKRLILFSFCLICFFVSCFGKKDFTIYQEINKWAKHDYLTFPLNTISDKVYTIDLIIKHSTEYKYQNLYLESILLQGERKIRSDTLSVQLTDSAGRWLSSCRNTTCEYKTLLYSDIRFKATGPYLIKIAQFSRDDTLLNIKGLFVTLRER